MPVQQLLLPHTAHYTTQYAIYPSPLHQVQTPTYIPQHNSQSHGYTSPHASTLGGVKVDPEEHFRVTHTTYTAPTSAAQPLPVAASDLVLAKLGNLERALRQMQGTDRQSYQFRDLCYFP